jgi:hypothetical protein
VDEGKERETLNARARPCTTITPVTSPAAVMHAPCSTATSAHPGAPTPEAQEPINGDRRASTEATPVKHHPRQTHERLWAVREVSLYAFESRAHRLRKRTSARVRAGASLQQQDTADQLPHPRLPRLRPTVRRRHHDRHPFTTNW